MKQKYGIRLRAGVFYNSSYIQQGCKRKKNAEILNSQSSKNKWLLSGNRAGERKNMSSLRKALQVRALKSKLKSTLCIARNPFSKKSDAKILQSIIFRLLGEGRHH